PASLARTRGRPTSAWSPTRLVVSPDSDVRYNGLGDSPGGRASVHRGTAVEPDLGKLIVVAIATVGTIAWLAGLSGMARARRGRRARAQEAAARFDIEDAAAGRMIVGEADVQGRPDELSERLARLLARDGMGPLGPVKIVACGPTELAFEPAGVGT